MKRLGKLAAILGAISLVAVGATMAMAAPMELKINTISATGSPWDEALHKFSDLVKAKTGGEIKVLTYADGQLGDIGHTITGMQMGTIDMGYFGLGSAIYLKQYAPLSVIYVPYLFKNKEEASRILNGEVFQPIYDKAAKESGVRVFSAYGARSPRAIQTTKGPITKPDDLKGMKLRIPGMQIFLSTFRAVGVKPTSLPMGEIYMGLQQGVVEGQDNGFDLSLPLKFQEVAKYWSATDHVYEVTGWFIGEKLWQSLKPEQQKIFRDSAKEAGDIATSLVDKLDADGIETVKQAGGTYTVPDRAAFAKAWADVYKEFEGKDWPAGMVEKIKAMQK